MKKLLKKLSGLSVTQTTALLIAVTLSIFTTALICSSVILIPLVVIGLVVYFTSLTIQRQKDTISSYDEHIGKHEHKAIIKKVLLDSLNRYCDSGEPDEQPLLHSDDIFGDSLTDENGLGLYRFTVDIEKFDDIVFEPWHNFILHLQQFIDTTCLKPEHNVPAYKHSTGILHETVRLRNILSTAETLVFILYLVTDEASYCCYRESDRPVPTI